MSFYGRNRKPLTEEEKCDDTAKAKSRALEILAGQEIASAQLYERLCRRYTEQAAAAAVADMMENGYLDDDRYAQVRAHGLLAARKSRRAVAQDLRRKGLSTQQVQQALESAYARDENGEDPELEAVCALIASRYRSKLANGRRDLVFAALMRRGFSYPVIKEALRRSEDEP